MAGRARPRVVRRWTRLFSSFKSEEVSTSDFDDTEVEELYA